MKTLPKPGGARPGEQPGALPPCCRARASAEEGDFDAALGAVEEARRGMGKAAGLILEAEVLLDAGRRGEGRARLEEARAADPRNIAAPGLLAVLDLEGGGMRGAQASVALLSRGPLWCPPVLTQLLLALEEEMERRSTPGPAPPALHTARTALFRPRLDRDLYRPFWLEGVGRFLGRIRGPEARREADRKHAVRAALRAGDLAAAAELLATSSPGRDPRIVMEERVLQMEIAFGLGRFEDLARLHRELIRLGGDPRTPYPAALAAYGLLTEGKLDRAREALAPPLEDSERLVDLRHLSALAELKRGARHRAAAEIRRAVKDHDIAMALLAVEESTYLSKT